LYNEILGKFLGKPLGFFLHTHRCWELEPGGQQSVPRVSCQVSGCVLSCAVLQVHTVWAELVALYFECTTFKESFQITCSVADEDGRTISWKQPHPVRLFHMCSNNYIIQQNSCFQSSQF